MNAISVQDTLIFVMVSMSASDRDMSDAEMLRIGTITKILPIFKTYNSDQMMNAVKTCRDILQDNEGMETVLGIASELPDHLKETAYALAAEIAVTDLSLTAEEVRFLQLLRNRLGIEKLICAALERGARARHQTA